MKAKYPLASFRVVNIDDLQEYHTYKNEVPVILINEALFSKFTVNAALLESAVAFQYKKLLIPSDGSSIPLATPEVSSTTNKNQWNPF